YAVTPDGTGLGLGVRERLGQGGPDAAADDVVLDHRHGAGPLGGLDEVGADGQHPPWVDDAHGDAGGGELLGHAEGDPGHGTDRDQEEVGPVAVRLVQDVQGAVGADGLDRLAHAALGEAHHGRAVLHLDRLAQRPADLPTVAGGGQPQPGHDADDGHVPHAVV